MELVDTKTVLRVHALGPFVPAPARRLRRALKARRDGLPDWSNGIPIRPEVARGMALAERDATLNALRGTPTRDARRAQWQAVSHGIVPLALGVVDRIAGTFAVEPRYPFLDPRLAELCLAIPADQKLRDGYNRSLARRGLADLMPEAVRLRGSKGAPGAAYAPVLEREERGRMDELILGDPGPITQYVDIIRLRELYRECLAGGDANQWYPIFRTVVGALWLEHARERYGLVA
jgi:asparagine synthase (glutamine-hydrolysing)